jgi:beta-lactamase superfamily II metal-dependent hydrolase
MTGDAEAGEEQWMLWTERSMVWRADVLKGRASRQRNEQHARFSHGVSSRASLSSRWVRKYVRPSEY